MKVLLLAAGRGILGQQDGRLGQQAYQHDQSGLHIDIVLEPPHPRKEETAHQTEGHTQDDGKRDEHTLVEGAEDEVDKDEFDDDEETGEIIKSILFFPMNKKYVYNLTEDDIVSFTECRKEDIPESEKNRPLISGLDYGVVLRRDDP